VTPRATQRRDRLHRWVWALLDAAIWFVAIYGATWLRFDFKATLVFATNTLLWMQDGLVFRLEADISREQAIAIAATVTTTNS